MLVQNPDEPDNKPSLQSYQLDLNQTGPMVSWPEAFLSYTAVTNLYIGSRCSHKN